MLYKAYVSESLV